MHSVVGLYLSGYMVSYSKGPAVGLATILPGDTTPSFITGGGGSCVGFLHYLMSFITELNFSARLGKTG